MLVIEWCVRSRGVEQRITPGFHWMKIYKRALAWAVPGVGLPGLCVLELMKVWCYSIFFFWCSDESY